MMLLILEQNYHLECYYRSLKAYLKDAQKNKTKKRVMMHIRKKNVKQKNRTKKLDMRKTYETKEKI